MQYTALVYYNSLSFSHRLTVFILSLSNLLTDTLFMNALTMEKPVRSQVTTVEKDARNPFPTFEKAVFSGLQAIKV